jgi:hypothetical protein
MPKLMGIGPMEISKENIPVYRNWFFFTILYLVVDYGRPQDIFSLGFLKPGMFVILSLSGFLLTSGMLKYTYNSKQIRTIFLFILLLSVYILFARNNYLAFTTTRDMLCYMPFILSVIACVNSIERLKKLIAILIYLMIFISIYCILHNGQGPGHYFTDENDVALYINMWIPFCYFLFFHEKEKLKKLIYGIGLVVGIISVVVTFSRGGFVGLISVGIIAWLFSSKKLVSLVVVALLVFLVYAYAGDAYWSRISTTTDVDEGTAKQRIEVWKSGWAMFLDNPLGVGGNNFPIKFPDYQTGYFKKNMWGLWAHSLWITLISELGIPGILLYSLLLYYNFKDIIFLKRLFIKENYDCQYLNILSRAAIASIAGYFVSGTFITVLYYPHYWYLTGIIVASVNIGRNLLNNKPLNAAVHEV